VRIRFIHFLPQDEDAWVSMMISREKQTVTAGIFLHIPGNNFFLFQDPRPMTLEMVKQTFAGQHEVHYHKLVNMNNESYVVIKVQYSQSKRNQALNSGEV
jgi:hypothetical protein